MNEEPAPPPPALRLKPRLRPPDGSTPGDSPASIDLPLSVPPLPRASEAAPAPAATAEPAAAPKIRLKPKLDVATPKNPEPAVSPSPFRATDLPAADPSPAVTPPEGMENPRVTAPAPPLFIPSSAPNPPPPLFITDPEPAPPAPAAQPAPTPSAATPGGDSGKFKLKPKLSPSTGSAAVTPAGASSVPPPALTPAVPPVFAPPPIPGPAKAPPPFPVMAPAEQAKLAPPSFASPPAASPTDATEELQSDFPPPAVAARKKGPRGGLIKIAAVVALACAGYFAWSNFAPKTAPVPAPHQAASETPPAKAPEAASAPLTPSDTLNALAHAPANAIQKAQDALATRRASGQARVDASSIGEDLPDRPFGPPPAAPTANSPAKTATAPVTTTTVVSPGIAATAHLEAAPEASEPFRAYVANAKVSGVYQGPPARVVINGRLTRVGDVLDPALGIVFDGVDSSRRHLLFKDRSGATVSRRF